VGGKVESHGIIRRLKAIQRRMAISISRAYNTIINRPEIADIELEASVDIKYSHHTLLVSLLKFKNYKYEILNKGFSIFTDESKINLGVCASFICFSPVKGFFLLRPKMVL